ncbi:MAG: hypothetical protein EBX36_04010 [Planctomycetia bacterium]|nr:hypothetical protein [Planctomycetia bacterium]
MERSRRDKGWKPDGRAALPRDVDSRHAGRPSDAADLLLAVLSVAVVCLGFWAAVAYFSFGR